MDEKYTEFHDIFYHLEDINSEKKIENEDFSIYLDQAHDACLLFKRESILVRKNPLKALHTNL